MTTASVGLHTAQALCWTLGMTVQGTGAHRVSVLQEFKSGGAELHMFRGSRWKCSAEIQIEDVGLDGG